MPKGTRYMFHLTSYHVTISDKNRNGHEESYQVFINIQKFACIKMLTFLCLKCAQKLHNEAIISRDRQDHKVAPNTKKCSEVAVHNRDKPRYDYYVMLTFKYDTLKREIMHAAQSANVSAQTDTDEPFSDCLVAIGVKGHTREIRPGSCSTEVWGDFIVTPAITLLRTICITRNEEATVE